MSLYFQVAKMGMSIQTNRSRRSNSLVLHRCIQWPPERLPSLPLCWRCPTRCAGGWRWSLATGRPAALPPQCRPHTGGEAIKWSLNWLERVHAVNLQQTCSLGGKVNRPTVVRISVNTNTHKNEFLRQKFSLSFFSALSYTHTTIHMPWPWRTKLFSTPGTFIRTICGFSCANFKRRDPWIKIVWVKLCAPPWH